MDPYSKMQKKPINKYREEMALIQNLTILLENDIPRNINEDIRNFKRIIQL
jgi:hypothetical protein